MPRTSQPRDPTRFTRADLQRLERAADLYLQDCYRKGTAARVSEFATYLHVSRPYLSRAIRRITGDSATAFLRARQLRRAQHLLETSRLTVGRIAVASAFGTARTLRRFFRIAVGMSPEAYRNEVTKCQSTNR
jgi:AraC-like DNA-binding protein